MRRTSQHRTHIVTTGGSRTDLGCRLPRTSVHLSPKRRANGSLVRQTDAILRKEVIQPHLPIRLPCYDFVPLTPHTLDGWLLAVTPPASGADNSGDVTGGVYKARERIQRSLADLRLLAIPASCRRVAACNPN
jgi:hypothetical protein